MNQLTTEIQFKGQPNLLHQSSTESTKVTFIIQMQDRPIYLYHYRMFSTPHNHPKTEPTNLPLQRINQFIFSIHIQVQTVHHPLNTESLNSPSPIKHRISKLPNTIQMPNQPFHLHHLNRISRLTVIIRTGEDRLRGFLKGSCHSVLHWHHSRVPEVPRDSSSAGWHCKESGFGQ